MEMIEESVASLDEVEGAVDAEVESEADAEAEAEEAVSAEHAHAPAAEADHKAGAGIEGDHRANDDGNEQLDMRPKAMKGTKHRKARLGLGTQVGADGAETGAPTPVKAARVKEKARIDVVANKHGKLEIAPGATPTEDQLFTRVATGGHKIHHVRGTVASPNVAPSMVPNNLFIDAKPHAPDVRQGGIGDCYFQSCMLGVTNNDPGKITSMMSITGSDVSVTLQRIDKKTGSFAPKTITTGASLLTRKNKHGEVSLVGSGMRIGEMPKVSKWWVELKDGVLEVHRSDAYETALWAPMMEKAYAEFSEKFGKYGDNQDKPKGSGYDDLDTGGAVEDCYQMFYGNAAAASTRDMTFKPGTNAVAGNWQAIRDLINYQATKGNVAPGQAQTFMHARIGSEGAASRGKDLIDEVDRMVFIADIVDDISASLSGETIQQKIARLLRSIDRTLLRTNMQALKTVITGFVADPKTNIEEDVAAAALPLSTPDAFPALWDDTLPPEFRQLRENLGILSNLGTDSSAGGRMVYTKHAYCVKSVGLADATGKPLALTGADMPARVGEIDADKSIIMMQNPHAANEPDLRGTGPADGINDGEFALTLDQFLRTYDLLRMNTVTH